MLIEGPFNEGPFCVKVYNNKQTTDYSWTVHGSMHVLVRGSMGRCMEYIVETAHG